MTIAIVSGYFDPIHIGHLELFRRAAKYGKVLVIINNDEQTILKKGKPFMDQEERAIIVGAMRDVYSYEISIDKDRTVRKTLEMIRESFEDEKLIFVNGGDAVNVAEEDVCRKLNIELKYGEGEKIQSSRWLINPK